MDHSGMDHGGMDHGGMDHGGHGGMDHGGHGDGGGGMDDMCSMSMLFTWDTKNLCIVFRQWHVRGTTSLVFSLLAIVFIAMGYEGLRSLSSKYERAVAKRIEAMPPPSFSDAVDDPLAESTPLFNPGAAQVQAQASRRTLVLRGLLYALQNFYAFMLMLVFMTYNGWVMIAVTIGCFLGFITFGKSSSSTKETACH